MKILWNSVIAEKKYISGSLTKFIGDYIMYTYTVMMFPLFCRFVMKFLDTKIQLTSRHSYVQSVGVKA